MGWLTIDRLRLFLGAVPESMSDRLDQDDRRAERINAGGIDFVAERAIVRRKRRPMFAGGMPCLFGEPKRGRYGRVDMRLQDNALPRQGDQQRGEPDHAQPVAPPIGRTASVRGG